MSIDEPSLSEELLSELAALGRERDSLAERVELSEARLAEAQALAHIGSWEWDISKDAFTGSDELCRIYGLEPGTLPATYAAYLMLSHPDDRAIIDGLVRQAWANHRPFRFQHRIVRADGSVRHLDCRGSVRLGPDDQPAHMSGTCEDVTDRLAVEAAHRRSLALLEAQREASIDGILVIDEHRHVLGFNRRFAEIWGIPPELMAAGRDEALLRFVNSQIADAGAFAARVEQLYASPLESSRDEIALRDGRVMERYSAPVLSPEGECFGRVWHFHDISDRKALEAALQAQNDKLQAAIRAKSDFVNSVSHELRNPLTSILGYTEFLQDDVAGALNPMQDEFVGHIQRGVRQLQRLVDDLLDVARLEGGAFQLKRELTDFCEPVRELLAGFRPQVEASGVKLALALPSTPVVVSMDPQRIEQVLANLVSNALKFTPRGGGVSVSVSAADGTLRCAVSDTGIGIAPEDQARLFQRFAQLQSGRFKGGIGLGLSISKAIVEAHDGTIGVESTPEAGSTFYFTLPLPSPTDLPEQSSA